MSGTAISESGGKFVLGTAGVLQVVNGGTGGSSFTANSVLTGDDASPIVAEANLTYDAATIVLTNGVAGSVVGGGIVRASAFAGCDWEDGNCGNATFLVFTASEFRSNIELDANSEPTTTPCQLAGVNYGPGPGAAGSFITGFIMGAVAGLRGNLITAVKIIPKGFRVPEAAEATLWGGHTAVGSFPAGTFTLSYYNLTETSDTSLAQVLVADTALVGITQTFVTTAQSDVSDGNLVAAISVVCNAGLIYTVPGCVLVGAQVPIVRA